MNTTHEPQLHWHLAFTKPLAEEIAKVHLERQGYGVYLPRLQDKMLRRGKWRDRIAALFPRYLFVRLDPLVQSLAPVRSTVGIANLVRFGQDYTVVPDRVVTDLIAHEDPQTNLHTLHTGSIFKPSNAVRIASGALAGLEGIFACEAADDRVIVLLNIFGRESRVKIDSGFVIPAAA
jgi:transcriptional antiterminator RfaH